MKINQKETFFNIKFSSLKEKNLFVSWDYTQVVNVRNCEYKQCAINPVGWVVGLQRKAGSDNFPLISHSNTVNTRI